MRLELQVSMNGDVWWTVANYHDTRGLLDVDIDEMDEWHPYLRAVQYDDDRVVDKRVISSPEVQIERAHRNAESLQTAINLKRMSGLKADAIDELADMTGLPRPVIEVGAATAFDIVFGTGGQHSSMAVMRVIEDALDDLGIEPAEIEERLTTDRETEETVDTEPEGDTDNGTDGS